MIARPLYLAALGLAVGALQVATAYGSGTVEAAGLALAVALGAVTYRQGEQAVTTGRPVGNVVVGFAVGCLLSLVFGTAALATALAVPVDLALWRSLLELFTAWSGVAVAFLAAYFLWGLVETFAA